MTDKTAKKSPAVWERLGRELYALEALARKILTDKDFQVVMSKKTMQPLVTAYDKIIQQRSDCENRMTDKAGLGDLNCFYGDAVSGIDPLVEVFRAGLSDEAHMHTERKYKT